MRWWRSGAVLGLCLAGGPVAAAGIDAQLDWSRRTELAVPVSGVVARVTVEAGERVARGQPLLGLDDAPFAAAVHEAEAQLARRQVERDEAARDARQAEELYARTVLSTVELENARMKRARAAAGVKEAQAALERARYRLRVSALRAPFDAVVLSRHAEPGQSVAAELKPPVLLVIAAAGEMLVRGRIDAERAAALKPGQALTVTAGGRKYLGRLKALAYEPEADRKAPYRLEVVVATTDVLHAGQAARIELP